MKLKRIIAVFLAAVLVISSGSYGSTSAYADEGLETVGTNLATDNHSLSYGSVVADEAGDNNSPADEDESTEEVNLYNNANNTWELGFKEKSYSDDEKVKVIVVMKDTSELAYSFFSAEDDGLDIQNEVIDLIEEEILEGEDMEIGYQYSHVLNGFSAEIPYGAIEEINAIPAVDYVAIQELYYIPESNASLFTIADGAMIGREDTWASGYTGKGVKIAIIDTGLDDDHPNFAALSEDKLTESSMTVEELEGILAANDLNCEKVYNEKYASRGKILSAENLYLSSKVAFAFNYIDVDLRVNHKDQMGDHGTHVAGIAAANDLRDEIEESSVGVAPDAQLFVMKVFGSNGGAYTEDIVAALEDACVLGADVINMSLGSAAGFSTSGVELFDTVYANVENYGVILSVSNGNSGTAGEGNLWETNTNLASNPDNAVVGAPATYKNATAIGSVENIENISYCLTVAGHKIAYTEGTGGQNASVIDVLAGGEYEYAMVPNMGLDYEDFAGAGVGGKIAVVSRGISSFVDKVAFAEEAGAVACIIYNNVDGAFGMSMENGYSFIPALSVSMSAGDLLASLADSGSTISFTGQRELVPSETAMLMSDFSSWGVSPDLVIKPDVAGPGGNIYSTVDNGRYDVMSGTSMAAPNVAGVSALIMQYVKENYPELSGVELRKLVNQMLVSTAVPFVNENDIYYSPRQQGSGLVNAYAATKSKVYLTVDGVEVPKASIGDDPAKSGVYSFSFNVVNFGSADAYYSLNTNALTEEVLNIDGYKFMGRTSRELSAVASEASAAFVYLYDFDGDGTVSDEDAAILEARIASVESISESELFRYDVNEDGEINDLDATALSDKLSSASADEEGLKVPANSTVQVTVTVTLSADDKAYMDSNFVNGIYVEGFTFLDAKSAGAVNLSIPYLAFYGDWTQAPVFDNGFYWESEEEMLASQFVNILFMNFGQSEYGPGLNAYVEEEWDESHISISPNGDGYGDYISEIALSLLRNVNNLNITYRNKGTGEVYYSLDLPKVSKTIFSDAYQQIIPFIFGQYVNEGLASHYYFTDSEGNYLPNGTEVELVLGAELDYDAHAQNNSFAEWIVPITVDTEAPVLKSWEVTEADGQTMLNLTFSDNVDVAAINILNKSGKRIILQEAVTDKIKGANGTEYTQQVDITGFGEELMVVLGDYALNESETIIRAEGNVPEVDTSLLYGYRVADTEYMDDSLYGWIGINKADAQTTVIDSEYYMDTALISAEYVGGYIIAFDAYSNLCAIKPGSWDERIEISKPGVNVRALSFDTTTGTLYAYDGTNRCLSTVDLATGELTPVSDEYLDTVYAMACDSEGNLYGIAVGYDENFMAVCSLRLIDKEDGVWGEVVRDLTAELDFTPYYAQSMTYVASENALYWASYNSVFWQGINDGKLNKIDLNNDYEFTVIGTIAGDAEVVGLLSLEDTGYSIPDDAPIESFELDKSSVKMLVNDTAEISVIRNPWYGIDEFNFTSSDESVVTVDEYGVISSYKVGEATITVTSKDNAELSKICRVAVIAPEAELDGFVVVGNTLENQWIHFDVTNMNSYTTLTEGDYVSFLAGDYVDGSIYAFSTQSELYKINPETFEKIKISEPVAGMVITDMAYNYADGFMYAISQNNTFGVTELIMVDLLTGTTEVVGMLQNEAGSAAKGIACSTAGTIYVLTYDGMLYTYEYGLNPIGFTGFYAGEYAQALTFDHKNGGLYWAAITADMLTSIMYVDTETGVALPLGIIDNGVQLVAMYSAPVSVPEREYVAAEELYIPSYEDSILLLEGSSKVIPAAVYPWNATDKNISWTSADSSVASVNGNIVTAVGTGRTVITGTLGDLAPVEFTVSVLKSAGNIYEYVLTDFSNGAGSFWASVVDNDLSSGEGLADADYEVYGGTYYDGKIYAYGVDTTNDYQAQYMIIDPESDYELITAIPGEYPDVLDMAFDYTEGAMYATVCPKNVDSYTKLSAVDIATGALYDIASMSDRIVAMTCTKDGRLIGASAEGVIYEINKTTGELTMLTYADGAYTNLYSSMGCDFETGNIYWAQAYRDMFTWEMDASLYLIDLQGEGATAMKLGKIGMAGSSVSCLYTIPGDIEVSFAPISKVLLDSAKVILPLGQTVKITAIPYPINAETRKLPASYRSLDESVATVDEYGNVTAISAGDVQIEAIIGEYSTTCLVKVVDDSKKFTVINKRGLETSPMYWPDEITSSVSAAFDSGLELATATYNAADKFFYGVDSEGCLWKFDAGMEHLTKLTEDSIINGIDNLELFLPYDDFFGEPVVKDITFNKYDNKLYALILGYAHMYGMLQEQDFVYEIDLENYALTSVAEIPYDISAPNEIEFCSADELFVYDGLNDYIYRMNFAGDYSMVCFAQSLFVGDEEGTHGMYYDAEYEKLYVATREGFYYYGMMLFECDVNDGSVKEIGYAAYDYDMIDIVVVENTEDEGDNNPGDNNQGGSDSSYQGPVLIIVFPDFSEDNSESSESGSLNDNTEDVTDTESEDVKDTESEEVEDTESEDVKDTEATEENAGSEEPKTDDSEGQDKEEAPVVEVKKTVVNTTVTEKKNGSKQTSTVVTYKTGNTLKTVVTKNAEGEITKTNVTVTLAVNDNKAVTLKKAVIDRIEKLCESDSADITIKAVDENGKNKYTIKVNVASLRSGKKLYLYKLDTKTGLYIKQDTTRKVTAKGNLTVAADKKATYVLVTAAEAKLLNK